VPEQKDQKEKRQEIAIKRSATKKPIGTRRGQLSSEIIHGQEENNGATKPFSHQKTNIKRQGYGVEKKNKETVPKIGGASR